MPNGKATPRPRRTTGDGALTRRAFLGRCCAGGFALAAGGSAAGVLSGCSGDDTAGLITLRVGYLRSAGVQHLLLAQTRRMFAREGLTVTLTRFDSPEENLNALVNGTQDVIHNPWTYSVIAYPNQKDLVIAAGSGKGGVELLAREGSVRTVEDLAAAAGKGLRVGTIKRDTAEVVTHGALTQAGVGYSDYRMTFFPDMTSLAEAMAKRQLDVCSLGQPQAARIFDAAGGTYLADSNDVWGPDAPDCVVSVKAGFLDRNKQTVEAYLNVLRQAARRREADFEKAVRELEPVFRLNFNVLAAALSRQPPQPVLDRRAVASLHTGVESLVELGYLQDDPLDEMLDRSVQGGRR
jgi:NitT/TauT family transport system substrate-binding protein